MILRRRLHEILQDVLNHLLVLHRDEGIVEILQKLAICVLLDYLDFFNIAKTVNELHKSISLKSPNEDNIIFKEDKKLSHVQRSLSFNSINLDLQDLILKINKCLEKNAVLISKEITMEKIESIRSSLTKCHSYFEEFAAENKLKLISGTSVICTNQ